MIKRLGGFVIVLCMHSSQISANDIENGERLAKLWCSSCHNVGARQRQTDNDAPNFSTIGRARNITESDLAQSLLAPHPRMPDRGLTRDEAADIAAYIRSFKNR